MIDYTVLGGYLGAGKTTLLNHVLGGSLGRRYGLIINDFGDLNIDARLIETASEQQINLANGCVCCSLGDGFDAALDTLTQLQPALDHIIVEASGVADVHNLAQYGHGSDLRLASVVVVADAETIRARASDKYVAQTVRRQLKAADLIILNKTDLCAPGQVDATKRWLRDECSEAPVVLAERCEVPLELVLDLPSTVPRADHTSHSHEVYRSWSHTTSAAVSKTALESFAGALGPTVLRAKGLVADADGKGTLELQVVGRRSEVTLRAQPCEPGEVVAIGLEDQLDTALLEALAARWLKPGA